MDRSLRTAVVVFTRDLRVHDNPALAAACREADAVVPLFVIDDSIVESAGANRIGFLAGSLRDLDRSISERGGRLVLRRGNWGDEVLATARSVDARTVHLAADVSGLAKRRTTRLRSAAAAVGIEVREHPGLTVVQPGELRPAGGAEYKVFTPYHRRWLTTGWRTVEDAPRRIQPAAGPQPPGHLGIELLDGLLPAHIARRCSPRVIAGGEGEARRRLDAFEAERLEYYAQRRDLLAADATSRLSAALHFGCLSPTEVAARLARVPGGEAVVRQLCWRDFFHQILAERPDAAHEDYRSSGHRWTDDPQSLEAWCLGRTGFPLVDAAMRQLDSEGFVHNRARMVVASFLCKDLHLDWRLGAAHFMSLLVDGDLANNQLNWQWVAGTGSDTNPHRIFNPVTQGRRYDPDGAYIRRHVPELAELDSGSVHWPDAATRRRVAYPTPLVDHHEAIAAYRALRG